MDGKLTAVRVKALKKPGRYGDGNGLWLQVRSPSRKSWLFRYKLDKRPRTMGLGPLRDVSLAEAREAVAACRKLLRQGIDPIQQRRTAAAAPIVRTFRSIAEGYIAAHEAAWSNAKHRQQWAGSLARYVYPEIGETDVDAIDTASVMRIIAPMWSGKTETASRVRGRIENVLDYAKAMGWRSGENPARWRGHLDHTLPSGSKVRRVQHFAALPWREIGDFVAELRRRDGVAARALEFAILTAARTGEVLGATHAEVDLEHGVWTVPAARMKAKREHRVPLSESAVAVLREMMPLGGPWLFPGNLRGRPLSAAAMLKVLHRMGQRDLTAHGMRSSFREWAAEMGYPGELAELALAHENKNVVEAAYLRGDALARRVPMMAAWATFCGKPAASATVSKLRCR